MSLIDSFFAGKSVFITGATGFVGKLLVCKLLLSTEGLDKIYLLVRPKRGKSVEQRLDGIFASQIFKTLEEKKPNFREKVQAIQGDICEPQFGMSDSDLQQLITSISVVIHSAATVKFDEKLKVLVQMNVVSVRELVALCSKLTKLEALVHVSTAYANCDRMEIEELVYPPPLKPHKLLEAMEGSDAWILCVGLYDRWMEDGIIETLTDRLIRPRPNTYTYSKALAEHLLMSEGCHLPIAIVRPSIVGATWREPVPGWVDNFNGPTGLIASFHKGLVQCILADNAGVADLIPVDVVVNTIIATAWYTATHPRPDPSRKASRSHLTYSNSLPVYNCTSGQVRPVTWGQLRSTCNQVQQENPVPDIVRISRPRFTTSRTWHRLNCFIDQEIPAFLMDCGLLLSGRSPMFLSLNRRIERSMEALNFFTLRQWRFSNHNFLKLGSEMTELDRNKYCIDLTQLDWDEYLHDYVMGTRQYMFRMTTNNLAEARRRQTLVRRTEILIVSLLVCVLLNALLRRFVNTSLASIPRTFTALLCRLLRGSSAT